MSINPKKSKFLTINGRHHEKGYSVMNGIKKKGLKIDNEKIEVVDKMKYLGIWINHDINPTDAIQHAITIKQHGHGNDRPFTKEEEFVYQS